MTHSPSATTPPTTSTAPVASTGAAASTVSTTARAAPYRSRQAVAVARSRSGLPSSMTLAEFTAYDWPDSERWELIHGVPLMSPSPAYGHQRLLLCLAYFLEQQLEHRRVIVDLDLRLPQSDSYVRPDLMVIDVDEDRELGTVPFEGIPHLAVEISSPSSRANDHGAKRDDYAQAGIPEYWAVDPATVALTIYAEPADGAYREPPADEEGYVHSPLLDVGIRIRRKADTYDVQTRG